MYTSIRTTAQLTSAIVACPNKTRQLAFLKDFINSVEHGIGFLEREYAEHKPFSKKGDASVGTVVVSGSASTGAVVSSSLSFSKATLHASVQLRMFPFASDISVFVRSVSGQAI